MKELSKKEKRIFRCFIESTKEIIEKEGIDKVSARKIGKISGYSYATIYNYFKDLKELLSYCAFDYLKECFKLVKNTDTKNLSWFEEINKYNETYFRYFAKRPVIFRLVFLENLKKYPIDIMNENNLEMESVFLKHLKEGKKRKIIKNKDVKMLHDLIASSIHGKLLFLITKRKNESIDQSINQLKDEIDFLLKR
ncbi:MAG: TetR/AcrR family transcriptional regulator [Bacillota bacterium]